MTSFLSLFCLCFGPSLVFSSPGALTQPLTLQGRIVKEGSNQPLESQDVELTLEIRSPGNECLLYKETFSNLDMTGSGGFFALSMGMGEGDSSESPLSLDKALDNKVPFPNLTCPGIDPNDSSLDIQGSYDPSPEDSRILWLSFNDRTPNGLGEGAFGEDHGTVALCPTVS